MANVLNRTTKEYRTSVNDPDYPVIDWIINPDLSAVANWPSRYWVVSGDVVTLMSQAQRDAVDAAEATAMKNDTADAVIIAGGFDRAFCEMLLDELNRHAAATRAILTAVANAGTLAALKTSCAAITPPPDRTLQQARDAMRAKL